MEKWGNWEKGIRGRSAFIKMKVISTYLETDWNDPVRGWGRGKRDTEERRDNWKRHCLQVGDRRWDPGEKRSRPQSEMCTAHPQKEGKQNTRQAGGGVCWWKWGKLGSSCFFGLHETREKVTRWEWEVEKVLEIVDRGVMAGGHNAWTGGRKGYWSALTILLEWDSKCLYGGKTWASDIRTFCH